MAEREGVAQAESGTQDWAELLQRHRDAVMSKWTAIVERSLAGRMTSAESSHDIEEILDALLQGAAASDGAGVRGGSFDGLRSLLSDLSRARARQGFSPTETAVSVFGLKDAMLDVLQDQGSVEGYRA